MADKLIRPIPGPWESPTAGTDLPYDFVPVALDTEGRPTCPVEAPVWHHGANADQKDLYSGELRCSLTTLTPLLVGNHQIALSQLEAMFRRTVETAPATTLSAFIQSLPVGEQAKSQESAKKKKISFPLMLPDLNEEPGAVLLPGESLKGMYRQAFGALMSAPLQHVEDATHSARPNAKFSTDGVQSRSCAGRIVKVDLENNVLEIQWIADISKIEFVKQKIPMLAGTEIASGSTHAAGTVLGNKRREQVGQWKNGIFSPDYPARHQWRDGANGVVPAGPYRYLNYHFTLDAGRWFMTRAGRSGDPHPGVLVPVGAFGANLTIAPAVVAQYKQTLEHLRCTVSDQAERDNITFPDLAVNDLIFCECRVVAGTPVEVISFGHNARYRWMHLDTVTRMAVDFDGTQWRYERRPELSAHSGEVPKQGEGAQPPAALSAVRNLLGYVAQDAVKPALGQLATLQDPFDRMAGRVSFNMAMERDSTAELSARFVNADQQCLLFMHPAVEPKTSFSRSYVPGQGKTWGDGIAQTTDQSGNPALALQNGTPLFAGRKFYPHQLVNGVLPVHHYDLNALITHHPGTTAHLPTELKKFLWSDQSGAAQYVSRENREFGFTVRFKDLRAWELAALAAVLAPDLLADAIRQRGPATFPATYALLTKDDTGKFGQKLGRGKAQGLGSVRIAIDVCALWQAPVAAVDWAEIMAEHLFPKLSGHDTTVRQWFEVLRLNPGRAVRPYLLHRSDNQPETIIAFAQKDRGKRATTSRSQRFP